MVSDLLYGKAREEALTNEYLREHFFASPLIRLLAVIIDGAIYLSIFIACSYLLAEFGEVSNFLRILVLFGPILLMEPFLVSWYGSTIGYRIFGLRARRSSVDKNLSFLRAFVRFVFKILFSWQISLIFMTSTKRVQGLHDLVADSIVCRRSYVPKSTESQT